MEKLVNGEEHLQMGWDGKKIYRYDLGGEMFGFMSNLGVTTLTDGTDLCLGTPCNFSSAWSKAIAHGKMLGVHDEDIIYTRMQWYVGLCKNSSTLGHKERGTINLRPRLYF